MSKKEYLLKLLDIVSLDALPIKEDLKLLIENDQTWEEIIDIFILIFKKAIENTDNKIEKEKIQKSIDFLNTIREEENSEKIKDNEDIEELLKNI